MKETSSCPSSFPQYPTLPVSHLWSSLSSKSHLATSRRTFLLWALGQEYEQVGYPELPLFYSSDPPVFKTKQNKTNKICNIYNKLQPASVSSQPPSVPPLIPLSLVGQHKSRLWQRVPAGRARHSQLVWGMSTSSQSRKEGAKPTSEVLTCFN